MMKPVKLEDKSTIVADSLQQTPDPQQNERDIDEGTSRNNDSSKQPPIDESKSFDQQDEQNDLDQVQTSDLNEVLNAIFQDYQRELLGTLYHMFGNWEDAQDAYQEGFMKCWRAIDSFDNVQNRKAWVFQVVINAGRDMKTSAWSRKKRNVAELEPMMPASTVNTDAIAERNEELEQVRVAIAKLKEEERTIFLYRQNGEFTYREIGEMLDLPIGTVKTRMRQAISNIRESLRLE